MPTNPGIDKSPRSTYRITVLGFQQVAHQLQTLASARLGRVCIFVSALSSAMGPEKKNSTRANLVGFGPTSRPRGCSWAVPRRANSCPSTHGCRLTTAPALEERRGNLQHLLRKANGGGVRFNEHIRGDGATVFAHACKLGFEGIVSKHRAHPYRSGPTKSWIKVKNPSAPGVLRFEDGT
jgi:hypothetical protein